MKQEICCMNFRDDNDNPTGGSVTGRGISILWQNGPLSLGGERLEPNGAFVEGVIQAARQRLIHYQDSAFACDENERAIMHLGLALDALESRTRRRTEAGIEGTHEVDPPVEKNETSECLQEPEVDRLRAEVADLKQAVDAFEDVVEALKSERDFLSTLHKGAVERFRREKEDHSATQRERNRLIEEGSKLRAELDGWKDLARLREQTQHRDYRTVLALQAQVKELREADNVKELASLRKQLAGVRQHVRNVRADLEVSYKRVSDCFQNTLEDLGGI